MAIDGKKLEEFKKEIDVRLNRQKQEFMKECWKDKPPKELHKLFEKSFNDLMQDYLKLDDSLKSDLDDFFNKKIKQAYGMEIIIFGKYMDYFKEQIKERKDLLTQKYSKWANSPTEDNWESLVNDYNYFYNDILMYSSVLKDNEKGKNKFLNADILKDEISKTNSFLQVFGEMVSKKKEEIDKATSNKDDKSKGDSEEDLEQKKLLYIKNLKDNKDKLAKGRPEVSKAIDKMIAYLNEESVPLRERIDLIEKETLDFFKYDINNNKFNVSGNSKTGSSSGTSNGNDTNRINNLSTEEYNKYLALASGIDDYVGAIEAERANILNAAIGGNSSLYETYSRSLNPLISSLKDLSKEAANASREYDEITDDFNKIRDLIKDKFKYDYKKGVKSRRRVVGVKRLTLGIGGVLIGAHGVSLIIGEILFYSKFGFVLGAPTFIPPILLVTLGAVLLKKALSSKEKSVVKTFLSKLSDKFKRGRRKVGNVEMDDENEAFEEDESLNDSFVLDDETTLDEDYFADLDGLNDLDEEENTVKRGR